MSEILKRLLIFITSKCNLRCEYCYEFDEDHPFYQTEKVMSLDMAKKVINTIYNNFFKIEVIQFFGGEPTLFIEVIQAIINETKETCASLDRSLPKFAIITNLTVLNDEILSIYKEDHFEITVSLDGPQRINDLLRKNVSGVGFSRIIEKNLLKLKLFGISFKIECTFTKKHIDNKVTIIDLLNYFYDIGASSVDIVCVMAKPKSDLYLYSNEILPLVIIEFREAIKYWFKHKNVIQFNIINDVYNMLLAQDLKNNRCPAGEFYLSITPSGDIYPCHLFTGNNKFYLGNINNFDMNTIKTSSLIAQIKNIPSCIHCNLPLLDLHCLGRNYFYKNDINLSYKPDCELRMAIINRVLNEVIKIEINQN